MKFEEVKRDESYIAKDFDEFNTELDKLLVNSDRYMLHIPSMLALDILSYKIVDEFVNQYKIESINVAEKPIKISIPNMMDIDIYSNGNLLTFKVTKR